MVGGLAFLYSGKEYQVSELYRLTDPYDNISIHLVSMALHTGPSVKKRNQVFDGWCMHVCMNRSPSLGVCNYPIFLSRRFHRAIYF